VQLVRDKSQKYIVLGQLKNPRVNLECTDTVWNQCSRNEL